MNRWLGGRAATLGDAEDPAGVPHGFRSTFRDWAAETRPEGYLQTDAWAEHCVPSLAEVVQLADRGPARRCPSVPWTRRSALRDFVSNPGCAWLKNGELGEKESNSESVIDTVTSRPAA